MTLVVIGPARPGEDRAAYLRRIAGTAQRPNPEACADLARLLRPAVQR